MGVQLYFDADACYRGLVDKLMDTADEIMEYFYKDAISGLDENGKADSKLIKAVEETSGYIIAKCEFYANALMQSFGTGSKADTSSESYWEEYKKSPWFNPSRFGKEIVGRRRGSYIDIFGEQRSTWGNYEGINIEGKTFFDKKKGKEVTIEPIEPKKSIQNAERWLYGNSDRRIDDKIEESIKDFMENEAPKYFREVNI